CATIRHRSARSDATARAADGCCKGEKPAGMAGTSRYGNERMRRRRALRRLSGRNANHLPPHLLRALGPAGRRGDGRYRGVIAAAGFINYNGEGSSGGSTITQQLVRALYPESIGTRVTLARKVREAIMAVRFARAYSKEQVLAMYLNEIYYGNRSYGIEAAAESYFNKSAKELDLAEASMLAGLPQAPSFYDPRHNFE